MRRVLHRGISEEIKWLLFFYSVPSKPVSNRMKVWRRLAKVGAIQLKGAVYVLPCNEEHYELFQWLVSEIISMKGDAAFVMVEKIETLKHAEIIDLFNQQREKDYRDIEKRLEELERKVSSIRKGAGIQNTKKILEQFNRHLKEFEEVMRIDFFSSKAGKDLKKKIMETGKDIKGVSSIATKEKERMVVTSRTEDYQGKTWVTRKKPFVDRMASAWLVKRFIDKKSAFKFIEENKIEDMCEQDVTFDIRSGEFTHIGDLCTFEVLLKSFSLKDKGLKKIAEIVHELDMKDGQYESPESKGVEEILQGIRKIVKDDREALEKGIEVFEMLYASKT